ncbi:hemerythrin domain-containing protein [Sphingomonas sp.]|jgi:hemerythrin superfamily protein|uniref:hemerythrin domain-containing protein n=1 Tax=Sphingomonas sp. TaxID=28214 RepID=UPI002DB77602|nr:hemerythrin domain-containing protein [Sphingomonas sp.]HEU4967550.1 hemerythrin domain-containing protein [Sphingomonas sp.]
MEITKALHTDHMELKKLIKAVNKSEDGAERKRLFAQFAELLVKHSRAEEKIVYDALIKTGEEEEEEAGYEGYTEHGLADSLLAQLKGGADPMSPEWSAQAKVMMEILDHHIKEEEDEVFSQVKEDFDTAERKDMGDAFEAQKEKVKA